MRMLDESTRHETLPQVSTASRLRMISQFASQSSVLKSFIYFRNCLQVSSVFFMPFLIPQRGNQPRERSLEQSIVSS